MHMQPLLWHQGQSSRRSPLFPLFYILSLIQADHLSQTTVEYSCGIIKWSVSYKWTQGLRVQIFLKAGCWPSKFSCTTPALHPASKSENLHLGVPRARASFSFPGCLCGFSHERTGSHPLHVNTRVLLPEHCRCKLPKIYPPDHLLIPAACVRKTDLLIRKSGESCVSSGMCLKMPLEDNLIKQRSSCDFV